MSVAYFKVERSLRRAEHSSRGVLPSVARVTECIREASVMSRHCPTRACGATKKKNVFPHFIRLLPPGLLI